MITVTRTSILHLHNADTLGGSEDIHHSIQRLCGGNPLGRCSHVLPINDNVHICQVASFGDINYTYPAAPGCGGQSIGLEQVVQDVTVPSRPASSNQLVSGDLNILNVQMRIGEESLLFVVIAATSLCTSSIIILSLPSSQTPAPLQISTFCTCCFRIFYDFVVVASDGKHPAVPQICQNWDGVLGHLLEAPGVSGSQADPQVTTPAQLLVLDLDEKNLPRLQGMFAKTHSICEALHSRCLSSCVIQSDIRTVDRVKFHELFRERLHSVFSTRLTIHLKNENKVKKKKNQTIRDTALQHMVPGWTHWISTMSICGTLREASDRALFLNSCTCQ